MPNLLLGVLRPAFTPAPVAGVAGYVAGGELDFPVFPTTPDPTDTTFKIAFPAETWSSTTAAPDGLSFTAGFSDDGVAGYVPGGIFETDALYKWSLPTDSSSATTSLPDEPFLGLNVFSDRGVAGYLASSQDFFDPEADLFRLNYPTDSFTTPTTVIEAQNFGGDADPGVAGYMPRSAPPEAGVWTRIALPTLSESSFLTFLDIEFTDGPASFCDPGVFMYATALSSVTGETEFHIVQLPTLTVGVVFGQGFDDVGFSSGFADDGVAGYMQVGEFDGEASDEIVIVDFTTASNFRGNQMPAERLGAGGFANMG